MTARLQQPPGIAAGAATLRIAGVRVDDPRAVEIAIVQSGAVDRYLDPRNPDDPWVTSVYRFFPVDARRDGADFVFELDYGVTWHLRPNRPYRLLLREAGRESEDRFTGIALRQPSAPPQGWTPPPDPRGPLQAPTAPAPPAAPAVASTDPPGDGSVSDAARGDAASAGAAGAVQPAARADDAGADLGGAATEDDGSTASHATPVASDDGARADPVPPPSRRGLLALVAALVAIAIAAVAWWAMRPPDGDAAKHETARQDDRTPPEPQPEPISVDAARRFVAGDPPLAPTQAMAKRYLDAGNLDGAFLLLRHAAGKGDAQAAAALGRMYDPATYSAQTSPLPAPNPAEAARWYRAAAESGDAEAQYRYGMLLRSGRTEEPNGPEIGVQWLQRAAEQGHEGARKALQ